MAQDVRSYFKGQLIFLGGVALALVGSAFLFIVPAIYYITAIVGLALALYGGFLVIFPGIMTGTDYAAARLVGSSGLFLLVGLGLYFVPFVVGWPILILIGSGQTVFFAPSLTLLYNGLLLMGLSLLGMLLLFPDLYRQWRMAIDGRYQKKANGIRSYSAVVAASEPFDEQHKLNDQE